MWGQTEGSQLFLPICDQRTRKTSRPKRGTCLKAGSVPSVPDFLDRRLQASSIQNTRRSPLRVFDCGASVRATQGFIHKEHSKAARCLQSSRSLCEGPITSWGKRAEAKPTSFLKAIRA